MLDVTTLANDKEFLRSLVYNGYNFSDDIDCFAFAMALLSNMASTDAELRDELSYMLLAEGIIGKGRLTPEQAHDLLMTTIDNDHLFFRIGESGTDSVFLRSFSNLVIASILYTDANNPTLSEGVMDQVRRALFRYAEQERDWRGYVVDKGWAHAMAHLADALDECAQHPAQSEQARESIMRLASDLAKQQVPLYHEEDVRLAIIPYHIILGRQVSDEFLVGWLDKCFVERGDGIASWTRVTNSKNFLRSLYFLLTWDNIAIGVASDIASILKKQDAVYIDEANSQ